MSVRVEFDELLAHASTGLIEAGIRYDPDAATSFGLFAQYRIRGAIFDGMRRMGYFRRAPKRLSTAPKGDGSGDDELAVTRAPRPALRPAVIVQVAFDDGGPEAVSAPEERVDTALSHKLRDRFVARALDRLPPRERRFLYLCYYEGETRIAAGAKLGLSRHQSFRLHAKAARLLREALASEGIRCFDDV